MRVGELSVKSKVDSSGFSQGISRMEDQARGMSRVLDGIFVGIGITVAQTAIRAVSELESRVVGAAKSAATNAMRYHELANVYAIIGKNAGYSAAQLDAQVKGLRAYNIQGDVAYEVLSNMIRSQIDLAGATQLARVAQDAAVLSGEDSSDTLRNLIYGIQTQNTEILRTHGIYIDVSGAIDKYAASLGKHAKDLSTTQRQQAVFNAVLENGKSIAGAYMTAMMEPGKVLRSLSRVTSDLSANLGELFYPLLRPVVKGIYDFGQSLIKLTAEGTPAGKLLRELGDRLAELWEGSGLQKLLSDGAPRLVDWFVRTFQKGGPARDMLRQVADAVRTTWQRIQPLLDLGGKLVTLFWKLLEPGGPLGKVLGVIGDNLVPVAAGLAAVWAFTKVVGMVQGLGTAFAALSNPIVAIAVALGAIVGGFTWLYQNVPAFKGQVDSLTGGFDGLLQKASGVGTYIQEKLVPVFKTAFEEEIKPELDKVGQALGDIFTDFLHDPDTADAFAVFAVMFPVALKVTASWLGVVINGLAVVIRASAALYHALYDIVVKKDPFAAWQDLSDAWPSIEKDADRFGKNIQDAWDTTTAAMDADYSQAIEDAKVHWYELINGASGAANDLGVQAGKAADNVIGGFAPVAPAVISDFNEMPPGARKAMAEMEGLTVASAGRIKTGVISHVAVMANTVGTQFEGMKAGAIRAMQALERELVGGSIVPDMVDDILGHFDRMAGGGAARFKDLTDQATRAASPLGRSSFAGSLAGAAAASSSGGGGGRYTVEVPVYLDGHEIARAVGPNMVDLVRRKTGLKL